MFLQSHLEIPKFPQLGVVIELLSFEHILSSPSHAHSALKWWSATSFRSNWAETHYPHPCFSVQVGCGPPSSWHARPSYRKSTMTPKWRNTSTAKSASIKASVAYTPAHLIKIHAKLFSAFPLCSCSILYFFLLIFKFLSIWDSTTRPARTEGTNSLKAIWIPYKIALLTSSQNCPRLLRFLFKVRCALLLNELLHFG